MVYEAIDSTWNMTLIIAPLIEEVINIIQKNDSTSVTIPSNVSQSDWKNIALFKELFSLKSTDWSTEAVGSFFIKNLKNIKPECKDKMIPLVNDLFREPKQNISFTDIAAVYTAMDFRVLDSEGHFQYSQQLSNILKLCLEDVQTNSFDNKTKSEMYVNKEIGNSAKYMEPSPCLNLAKFPKCKDYCIWHQNFFENMPKNEFLTIMKHGLPQRRIR